MAQSPDAEIAEIPRPDRFAVEREGEPDPPSRRRNRPAPRRSAASARRRCCRGGGCRTPGPRRRPAARPRRRCGRRRRVASRVWESSPSRLPGCRYGSPPPRVRRRRLSGNRLTGDRRREEDAPLPDHGRGVPLAGSPGLPESGFPALETDRQPGFSGEAVRGRGPRHAGPVPRSAPRSIPRSVLRSAARHRTRLLRPGPVGNRQRPVRKEQEQRDRCGEDSHGGLPRIVSASRRGRFRLPPPPVRPPGALVESASAMDPGLSVGRVPAALFAVAVAAAACPQRRRIGPEGRGPTRDGRSPETGLPNPGPPPAKTSSSRFPTAAVRPRWSSETVSSCKRVRFRRDPAGTADGPRRGTGALLWEQRRNIYHSDAPPRRVGWASPAVDAETGTVFSFTVGGGLTAFRRRGRQRPLGNAPSPRSSASSPPTGAGPLRRWSSTTW